MGATMARNILPLTNDSLREAASLLDEAVTDIRNRGYTRDTALSHAAGIFGLTASRVKKFIYGEVVAVSEAEREAIRRQYREHLARQADYHAAQLEAAKARLQQMDMPV